MIVLHPFLYILCLLVEVLHIVFTALYLPSDSCCVVRVSCVRVALGSFSVRFQYVSVSFSCGHVVAVASLCSRFISVVIVVVFSCSFTDLQQQLLQKLQLRSDS